MNTYDEAHALAKAIRECDEMKRLTQAAEKIKSAEYVWQCTLLRHQE